MPPTDPSPSDRLYRAVLDGRAWQEPAPPEGRDTERDGVRQLLREVFAERYHVKDWTRFQARNALKTTDGEEGAPYAGVITAENPGSGPYQGTSWVWFPGEEGGSVVVLVIGTGGFGADAQILGRPGHRRRLQALARLHGARLWAKPDPLDLASRVPAAISGAWNASARIPGALKKYGHVIYAAVAVRDEASWKAALDLLDLFAHEHAVEFKGAFGKSWEARRSAMTRSLFPVISEDDVARILEERRFVVLQGPPGTGKTRLASLVAKRFGQPTTVQFHPARTYEDFVIGLAPQPAADGLSFTVRHGDLLVANARTREARDGKHVLFIDEINRGDLSRVLGEAIYLFEVGDPNRDVELPHPVDLESGARTLRLEPGLFVLGTRNTADRSIARIDLAIRRRFAFLDVWPDLDVVRRERCDLAVRTFEDTLTTFTEFADEAGLTLVPGHAYFLDPRHDLPLEDRPARVARRLEYELLPLLRTYVDERLLGPATAEIEGLADRIAAALREVATAAPGAAAPGAAAAASATAAPDAAAAPGATAAPGAAPAPGDPDARA